LTEACFQETPMAFADDSSLMLSNGTMIKVKSTFVSEGTLPAGAAWQMLAIPDTHHVRPSGASPNEAWAFEPPCYEPAYPDHPLPFLSEGRCSGQWITNITIYDQLRVPEHLPPGDYVRPQRSELCSLPSSAVTTRRVGVPTAAGLGAPLGL
jgi:hypothetical protein